MRLSRKKRRPARVCLSRGFSFYGTYRGQHASELRTSYVSDGKSPHRVYSNEAVLRAEHFTRDFSCRLWSRADGRTTAGHDANANADAGAPSYSQ